MKTSPPFARKLPEKNILIFSATVLAANLLLLAVYPLYNYLIERSGGIILILLYILYYSLQFLDIALSFFAFAFLFMRTRKEGIHGAVAVFLPLFLSKLFYQLLYGIIELQEYTFGIVATDLLLNYAFYVLLHILLFLPLYYVFLRGNRDDVAIFAPGQPLFTANAILALLFFLARMIIQIVKTVNFINDQYYGIPSLMNAAEVALMIWDFLFIFISVSLAYILLCKTEKRLAPLYL